MTLLADFGINSFFTLWFTPQVKAYRDVIKALEEEEAAAEEAAKNAESVFVPVGGDSTDVFF